MNGATNPNRSERRSKGGFIVPRQGNRTRHMSVKQCSAIVRSTVPLMAVVVAACDSDPTGPITPALPDQPAVGFNYSGTISGTYAAAGEVQFDTERRPRYGTWAAGIQVTGSDLSVAGAVARDAPLADVFLLALHEISQPGTYEISASCTESSTDACVAGFLAFGLDWDDPEQTPEPSFRMTSGIVTLTALADDRLQGQFTATASDGGDSSITLTAGGFDVSVHRDVTPVRAVQLRSIMEIREARRH